LFFKTEGEGSGIKIAVSDKLTEGCSYWRNRSMTGVKIHGYFIYNGKVLQVIAFDKLVFLRHYSVRKRLTPLPGLLFAAHTCGVIYPGSRKVGNEVGKKGDVIHKQ
jgi:hypothetical protein